MSLIIATHAAPAVRGVTRVGLGIILELVSLSMHELHEARQLVSVSDWLKMSTHPHPSQPRVHRRTGITTCLCALASGSSFVWNYGRRKRRLWCVFFFSSFNWLLSSGCLLCLGRDTQCISWFFKCNHQKKKKKLISIIKRHISPSITHCNSNESTGLQKDKNTAPLRCVCVCVLNNYRINHYQAWRL